MQQKLQSVIFSQSVPQRHLTGTAVEMESEYGVVDVKEVCGLEEGGDPVEP